jgi:methionyl-tRNA formyltransferase
MTLCASPFMGTPDFAVPTLAELIGAGHDIAAVYTQPRAAQGSRAAPRASPVAEWRNARHCRFARRNR